MFHYFILILSLISLFVLIFFQNLGLQKEIIISPLMKAGERFTNVDESLLSCLFGFFFYFFLITAALQVQEDRNKSEDGAQCWCVLQHCLPSLMLKTGVSSGHNLV